MFLSNLNFCLSHHDMATHERTKVMSHHAFIYVIIRYIASSPLT